jgi:soluble lytic murein transglycosylase-like protein
MRQKRGGCAVARKLKRLDLIAALVIFLGLLVLLVSIRVQAGALVYNTPRGLSSTLIEVGPEIAPASDGAVWALMQRRWAERGEYDPLVLAEMYDLMQEKAAKYGLPLTLVAAVVDAESRFNPRAKSRCGAKGLMQIMPYHYGWLGITDPYNPEQSLDGGCRFLANLIRQYHGSAARALGHYNGGYRPDNPETRAYVPKVLGIERRLRAQRLEVR